MAECVVTHQMNLTISIKGASRRHPKLLTVKKYERLKFTNGAKTFENLILVTAVRTDHPCREFIDTMGIYDRDYYRKEPAGHPGNPMNSAKFWPVWQKIIALTAGVFVLQLLFPPLTQWLSLSDDALYRGQIWRLLSYAFVHGNDIFHILMNMLFLYFFGRRLESMYGGKEFGLFYAVAAVFSGLFIVLIDTLFHDSRSTIGASGAVLALVMIYTLHFPRERIYLFGIVPIEMRWLMGFMLIFDLFPVLKQLGGSVSHDGISHAGHLGGALFGYLYFKFHWRISRLADSLSSKGAFKFTKPGPKLKIYNGESSEELDAEVDRILQKINEKGEASLTSKERKTLKNASERYKNRNS